MGAVVLVCEGVTGVGVRSVGVESVGVGVGVGRGGDDETGNSESPFRFSL